MANLRFEVVAEAFKKRPVEVEAPKVRPSEYFAKYVFNRQKMYKYLPSDVYEKLIDVIDNGTRLDRSIADAVAAGMKLWAEENGVTHYTHWFQPLTEGTAEKHDAFVEHDVLRETHHSEMRRRPVDSRGAAPHRPGGGALPRSARGAGLLPDLRHTQ